MLARLPVGAIQDEECSVVMVRVLAQDPGYGLSYLDFEGERLSVNLSGKLDDQSIRVRIPARDVAISLSEPESSSMLNCIPASIEGFQNYPNGQRVLLKLRCGDQFLLSKITRKSFDLLGLRTGQRVYASIKTVSMSTEL